MVKESLHKISRRDWIAIGLRTLVEEGIEAVRVEPIARLLNVTRGSFYWHFKCRDEWLNAMLEEWEHRKTKGIIEQTESSESDPSQKLLKLFETVAEDNEDTRLEQAIRTWAANDPEAAAAIARVDQQRITYVESLFCELGFSETDAKVRAYTAYSVKVGWAVVVQPSSSEERLAQMRFVHKMLTQAPADGL